MTICRPAELGAAERELLSEASYLRQNELHHAALRALPSAIADTARRLHELEEPGHEHDPENDGTCGLGNSGDADGGDADGGDADGGDADGGGVGCEVGSGGGPPRMAVAGVAVEPRLSLSRSASGDRSSFGRRSSSSRCTATFQTRMGAMLAQRDAFGLTPLQRAYDGTAKVAVLARP